MMSETLTLMVAVKSCQAMGLWGFDGRPEMIVAGMRSASKMAELCREQMAAMWCLTRGRSGSGSGSKLLRFLPEGVKQ